MFNGKNDNFRGNNLYFKLNLNIDSPELSTFSASNFMVYEDVSSTVPYRLLGFTYDSLIASGFTLYDNFWQDYDDAN